MSLRPALQALLLAPDPAVWLAVLEGRKRITIRTDHRDYRLEHVMICCHHRAYAVEADITDVRHCLLSEVTEEEYRADGFTDQNDMLTGLQKFYPNVTLDSPMTVIRWANVRGGMVDNPALYLYND